MTRLSESLYAKVLVLILLLAALGLRLKAAGTMPIAYNESMKMAIAKDIADSQKKGIFLLVDKRNPHSLISVYVMMVGQRFFSAHLLGGRILFVIFGVIGIFFVYLLVKENLGEAPALAALGLLAADQFLIGETAQIREESPLLLCAAMAVYFFFRALKNNSKWIILAAVCLGLGALFKEVIIGLGISFVLFICTSPQYRRYFNSRHIMISCLLMFLIILPYISEAYADRFIHYQRVYNGFGFSLRVIFLYWGEILLWLDKHSVIRLPSELSLEFPVVHWVTGFLIMAGVFYSLKKENHRQELIRFCLIFFGVIVAMATFFDPTLFDSHWRASLSVYPGLILLAHMLVKVCEQGRGFKLGIILLMCYFFVWSFYVVPAEGSW